METSLSESVWQRAKHDTVSAFHTLRFWLYEVCIGAGFTIFVLLWTPLCAKEWVKTVYQVLVPLLGVFVGLALLFLFFLVVAPYRQRDETRSRVATLESEIKDKTQRARIRLDIGTLIIEGTEVLKGFTSVHTFGDVLPIAEFKIWRESGYSILVKYGLTEDYILWFRDVGIDVSDSPLDNFVGACEAGLDRLEGILARLRD